MGEIAKCPICGNQPIKMVFGAGWAQDGYTCCGNTTDTLKQWNQYAAAMEYAKKTAYWFGLPGGVNHQEDSRAEKAMTDAETRVLEVFGK